MSQARPGCAAVLPSDGEITAALAGLPLRRIDEPWRTVRLSDAHRALAFRLVRVARTGESEALLSWPQQPDGVVAVFSAAALALASVAPSQEPYRLRAFYYPWTLRASESAKNVLIERRWLEQVHFGAIGRQHQQGSREYSYGYSLLMARVRDLERVRIPAGRGREFEAFLHPALDEIFATDVLGSPGHAHPVLYRVRKHTEIRRLHFAAADTPSLAPYALLGICADHASVRDVRAAPGGANVIILNLLQSRCDYLGPSWQRLVSEMLASTRAASGHALPVLAITDDPWVQHVLASQVLPKHQGSPKGARARRSSVLNDSQLTEDRPPFVAGGARAIHFQSPSGAPSAIEDTFRTLLEDAQDVGERDVVALLLESREAFRRLACLPASLSEWRKYLEDAGMSPGQQADALASMGSTLPLQTLLHEHAERYSVQCNRERIESLVTTLLAFEAERSKSRSGTGEAFRQLIDHARRAPGRTVFVVADDRTREFVEHLADSPDDASPYQQVLVSTTRHFLEVADERVGSTSSADHAVVLGVGRKRLLHLFGARTLPDTVTVLAPVGVVRALAADAAALGQQPAFDPLSSRLDRVSCAAMDCVQRCTSELPDLEWSQPPVPETRHPTNRGIVDLRGAGGSEPTDLIIITDSGPVLARPGTNVVRYNPDAPVDAFQIASAGSLIVGDKICILDAEFHAAVKERIGSGTQVEAGVRAYHRLVAEKLPTILGHSLCEKAAHIAALLGKDGRAVPATRVRDWLRADQWLKQDDNTVRPHAPRYFEDFQSFLAILGAPKQLSQKLWVLGIAATRTARLSAGLQFSDVWLNILAHTLDMANHHPEHAADIWAIRARAESSVAVILEIRSRHTAIAAEEEVS